MFFIPMPSIMNGDYFNCDVCLCSHLRTVTYDCDTYSNDLASLKLSFFISQKRVVILYII